MGFMEKLARKKLLSKVKEAIEKAYQQGRLQFLDDDDSKVKYTDKEGNSKVFTIDECADYLWDKMNNEFGDKARGANLAIFGIIPENVKNIILGLR